MSDIITELRERSLLAEQEGDPLALLDEAADEIERLRLTDAEREAVECGIGYILDAEHYGGDEPLAVVALRGLLERLGYER